jgi:hypothetical protein
MGSRSEVVIMKGWIKSLFTGGIESIGKAIDDNVTNKEERMILKNEAFKIFTEISSKAIEMQGAIIQSEAKGNWLQRSWRPILMLSFGFIIIYSKFISQVFGLTAPDLEPQFWQLLQWGVGGYVIGRSGEKIANNLTITKK